MVGSMVIQISMVYIQGSSNTDWQLCFTLNGARGTLITTEVSITCIQQSPG